jgi:hypothetical protein
MKGNKEDGVCESARLPNFPTHTMPDWLYGIFLFLSGVWVMETALFLLSYRAFGRS